MDQEEHDQEGRSSQQKALIRRLHELRYLRDEAEHQWREIEEGSMKPSEDGYSTQLMARFILLAYAGAAILIMNVLVTLAIGPENLLTNLVVACLLMASFLIGMGFVAYAIVMARSHKQEVRLQELRQRRELRQTVGSTLHRLTLEYDMTKREISELHAKYESDQL